MQLLRRAHDRMHTDAGWLDSWHTFSFGEHHDEAWMGFHGLRVINDDTVAPGRGFGAHGHRDMEIISYVVKGALSHQDSLGNGSVIVPGDVQRMSAGTGVRHSEQNAQQAQPTHFLQIWITPGRRGDPPGYEQKRFAAEDKLNRLTLVGARDGRDGAVTIHSDADLWATLLDPGVAVELSLAPGRHAWVQVVEGSITVNGTLLSTGDGLGLSQEPLVKVQGTGAHRSEVLLFDLL